MGHQRRIVLDGFEEALVDAIAGFAFEDEYLKNHPLRNDVHLYVNDMPEVEEVASAAAAILVPDPPSEPKPLEYDPDKEPTVSVYTEANEPIRARGSRHEWQIRFALRLGTVFEDAKQRLEQLLVKRVLALRGRRAGAFFVNGLTILQRPTVFQRAGDLHAFATCVVRFFVVPRPTLPT